MLQSYICRRPTSIVLATINTTDFLYTCSTHLTDPGFATPVTPEPSSAVKVSEAEIKKIKEEWEAKQKLKRGKEAEEVKKDGSKDTKDNSKDAVAKTDKDTEKSSPGVVTAQPTQPSHPRFTLHRQIFAMRLSEHKKRRQAQVAKTVAPKLPSVPLASSSLNSIPPPPPPLP